MFGGPATVVADAFPPEVLEVYKRAFRAEGALTPPLEYYRNMDRNWELTAPIADRTIDVPCLMISAAGDLVLTPTMAEGMEARVPNLEKIVIEHCGHWTQQEPPRDHRGHARLPEPPRPLVANLEPARRFGVGNAGTIYHPAP